MQHHDSKENEHSNFMETIENIRKTEHDAEQILKEANERAETIARKAKEGISKIKADAEENAVSLKNEILHKGRQAVEKEVEAIIKKAKQEAEKTKDKTIPEKDLPAFLKNLIS